MKPFLILKITAVCFAISFNVKGQNAGAQSSGLGSATLNLNDVWSVSNNIASLTKLNGPSCGFNFINRFGIKGLNNISFAYGSKHKNMAYGLAIERFGDQLFNTQKLSIGIAHVIDNVSLGIKINTHQVYIHELGTKHLLSFSLSGRIKVNETLDFAALIDNFTHNKTLNILNRVYTPVLKGGFCYHPNQKVSIHVEAEKREDYGFQTILGIEYWVIESFAFRTGISSLTSSIHFGIGFKLNQFVNINYALNAHQQLGVSNHISLELIKNIK